MDVDDLTNRFRYHRPDEERAAKHTIIRQKCYELAVELNGLIPDGREKSLAITNLEDVMFWANAALARYRFDEPNGQ